MAMQGRMARFFRLPSTTQEEAMKIAKLAIAGALLACILPAAGEDNGLPGTVNSFTPAQKTRAFAAATQAGYSPIAIEAFQDGNFFLTASKGGERYEVTVVASGQVYPSTPIVPAS
jgi:hypothetical protein